MIKAVLFSLIAGIGGLWIATKFVPGVTIQGSWSTLLIPGVILGIIIAVIEPLLKLVSFIIRLLLLLLASAAVIWMLKLIFPALAFSGFMPMAITAAIVAGIAILFSILK